MSGELLGSATLELDADLAPLDASLSRAEARVAQRVAVMQAMIDSLHGDVNIGVSGGALPAGSGGGAAAVAAGRAVPVAPAAPAQRSSGPGSAPGLYGVRGPDQAGSTHNPIVMVLESSKYTPLGSYAASIGTSDATDSQRSNSNSGLAALGDFRAIRDQLSNIADSLSPAAQLAQAGQNGLLTPATQVAQIGASGNDGSTAATAAALQQAADALSAIRGQLNTQQRMILSAPTPSQTSTASHGMLTPIPSHAAARSDGQRSSTSPIPVIIEGRAGSGSSGFAGGAASGGAAGGSAPRGPSAAISPPSGGGGRRLDVFHHDAGMSASGGGRRGGGGGGSRNLRTLFGGSRNEPDRNSPFSFGNIFKGDDGRGGAFGLPGFGSVGSLGGLGLEHIILTALGVGASGTAAAGGAALVGTASLTKSLIGGGSDALINKATSSQIEATTKDYYALQTAVAEYGKGSKQAVAAQNLLNYSIKQMGAAAPAELKVYTDLKTLHNLFETDSAGARTEAAEGMDQIVQLGTVFTPLVTQAAQRNLGIINTGLKPLFTWLEGPQGMGIFRSLENSFASTLPTSIHAVDMAVEDFLRLIQATLPYTGGLASDLNSFFTEKNHESAARYQAEVQKLVGNLREWERLLKLLGEDVGDLFHDDAGTANSIVGELTQMLGKLHDWETSSQGQGQLKSVFAVHKQEIDELLNLLPTLAKGYGSFYLDVAPPLVLALTHIAGGVDAVVTAVEKIPGGADLVGLSLVLGKLGILGPGLRATAKAMGLMTAAEKANAPIAATDAGANRALDSSGLGATGVAGGGAASTAARDAEGAAGTSAVEDAAGGAGAAGLLSKLPKVGSVFDRLAASGFGTATRGAVVDAATGAGMAAEGAGMAGLADSIGVAGAAVAPIAAGLLPLLAAAGGVAGLIELFHLFSSSNDPGQTVARHVAKGLGIQVDQTGNLSKAVDTARQASSKAATAKAVQSNPIATAELARIGIQPTGPNAKQIAGDYRKAGQSAITAFISAIQSAKFPSTLSVFEQARTELNKLPPQARDAAAKTMLDYAQELQQQGKLPKGAVSDLIAQLEAQFPGFRTYLKKVGMGASQDFASSMNLAEAVSNTKSAVTELQNEFGTALFPSVKLTSKNLLSTVTGDFSQLRDNMGNLTKAGRIQAEQELSQLKTNAVVDATAMEQQVSNKIGLMGHKIATGNSAAIDTAIGEFGRLASGIAGSVSAGDIAVDKGTQLIAEALNQTLKALGAKTIPIATLKAMSPSELLSESHFLLNGAAGTGGHGANRATGGLVQLGQAGQKGHDTIPLSVNGLPIRAGAGEKVAVFNHDQQAVMDAALMARGYAGLDGMFSSVNRPHYMASGGFVPGFAGGGNIDSSASYAQLEGLWEAAGGPARVANVAAAIAEAESSGINQVQKGEDFQNTGWGYWQITPGGPQYLNPMVNARQAVSDYNSRGFEPWTTFNDGAYRQFLHGGVPASAAGAMLGQVLQQIAAPHVDGTGPLATIANASLAEVAKAANSFLSAHAPTQGAGGGAGPGTIMATNGKPANVEAAMMAAASQIVGLPYTFGGGHNDSFSGDPGYDCSGAVSLLLHAAGLLDAPFTAGLGGSVMGWGEPGPGKFITVGTRGSSGADAHMMMSFFGKFIEAGGGGPLGKPSVHWDGGWDGSFDEYRHPAGYAGGGLVGDFGEVDPALLLAGDPSLSSNTKFQAYARQKGGKAHHGTAAKHKKVLPKHPAKHGHAPKLVPGGDADISKINAAIKQISGLVDTNGTGDAARLTDLLSFDPQMWALTDPNLGQSASAYIITQDANGNPITPQIDWNAVMLSRGELGQEVGWDQGIVGDLQQAIGMVPRLQSEIQAAVRKRQLEIKAERDRIEALRTQIRENLKAMADLQNQVTTTQNDPRVASLQKQIQNAGNPGLQLQGLQADLRVAKATKITGKGKKADERRQQNADLITSLEGQIKGVESGEMTVESLHQQLAAVQKDDQTKIAGFQAGIGNYAASNRVLGGKGDAVGAGGKIGTISRQVDKLSNQANNLKTSLADVSGSGQHGLLTIEGVTGLGGYLGPAEIKLATDAGTLAGLQDPALQAALTADQTGAAAPVDNSTLAGLLEQQNQQLAEQYAVSQRQYAVLANLPPYGGSFATGGVVPGPVGAAATIIAHGGEVITSVADQQRGGGDTHVHVSIAGKDSYLRNLIQVEIQNASRTQGRQVIRRLPGRGGGVLTAH